MLNPIPYVNQSGVAVPRCGLLIFYGNSYATTAGDSYVIGLDQPGSLAGGSRGPVYVDAGYGATASGDGRYSTCYRATEGPVWVAYDPGAATPSAGSPCGPVRGQFYMNQTGGGFVYLGGFDSTNKIAFVIRNPCPIWAQTSSTISAGALNAPTTFQVNVWIRSGSLTYPTPLAVATDAALLGLNVVNRNPGLSTAVTGKACMIAWNDELMEYFPTWIDC